MHRVKRSRQIPTKHERLSRQALLGASIGCFVLAAIMIAAFWGLL